MDTGGTCIQVHLAGLLSAWSDLIGDETVTAGEAVHRCKVEFGDHDTPDKAALREALLAVAGYRDTIDPRRLGKYLRDSRNRIEGGLVIRRGGERHKVALWLVEKGGSGGSGGIIPYPSREFGNAKKGIEVENTPPKPPTPPRSAGREPGDDPEDFTPAEPF